MEKMHVHVRSEPELEVGGVLIGKMSEVGARVIGAIPFEITGQVAELTVTHEAWNQVYRRLDLENPGMEIVGWYHSHPGHGIFLSQRDVFIHREHFSLPGHIAYVIDPQSGEDGFFGWDGDRLVRLPVAPRDLPQEARPPRPPRGAGRSEGPRERWERSAAEHSANGTYPLGGYLVPLVVGILVGVLAAGVAGVGRGSDVPVSSQGGVVESGSTSDGGQASDASDGSADEGAESDARPAGAPSPEECTDLLNETGILPSTCQYTLK